MHAIVRTKLAKMITPDPSINPYDILVWSDGFCCFREDLSPKYLRDDKYYTILCGSDKWLMMITKRKVKKM